MKIRLVDATLFHADRQEVTETTGAVFIYVVYCSLLCIVFYVIRPM